MVNKGGKTVEPTGDSVSGSRLPTLTGRNAPGYYLILTDQPGDKSWPIVATTFVLMHKDASRQGGISGGHQVLQVLVRQKGGKMAEELDYIPMPESVVKLIEKTWSADIKS